MAEDRRASLSHAPGMSVVIAVLFGVLIAFSCAGQAAAPNAPRNWLSVASAGTVLVLATAVSGWFFGRSIWRAPFSVGLAAFGAACGIGIGLVARPAVSQDLFASMVPALATVFGGTLVCSLSAKLQSTTTRLGDKLSHATATCGIPLLFGLSLSARISGEELWPTNVVAISITLAVVVAVVIAVGLLLGRLVQNAPLNLAAAGFGAFVGMATGLSSKSLVVYVASAVLGLFTWAASYAFVTSPSERRKIGAILLSFGILLVLSLLLGAITRMGLGWGRAPFYFIGFCAIMLPTAALGIAVGTINGDRVTGAGVAAVGSGVGLLVGLSLTDVTSTVGPGLVAMLAVLAVTLLPTDRKNQAHCYRLLGVFAVLSLLSAFGGCALRQGDLLPTITLLKGQVADLERQVEELESAAGTVAGGENQPDASIRIWLEGRSSSSAVLIDVRVPLEGILRVIERVDGRVLYAGIPAQGEHLRLSGESLEVSWPASAGVDSVGLTGWDRMVKQNGTWTVDGAGKTIDTSKAKIQNGRFILIFPSS